MDLVIARCNECFDWLSSFCERKLVDRIFIYNKGNTLILPQYKIPITIEDRPNKGRDVESYFYHITKYYDCLGNHTLFLQANPFDHSHWTSWIKDRSTGRANWASYYMGNKLLAFKTHPSIQSKLFFFGDTVAYDTGINNPRWAIIYRYLFYGSATDMVYSAGAQYIVSCEAIRYRSKAFYAQTLSIFKNAEKIIGIPGIGINHDAQPGISAIDLIAYPFEGIMPIMWDMTTTARN